MQIKPLLLGFCLLLTSTNLYSQLVIGVRTQQEVVLFSGDTLHSDLVTYQFLNSGQPCFELEGSRQFSSDSVRFVTNFHGTFINLRNISRSEDQERYAMRIQNKKIQVYEEVEMEIYGGEHLAVQRTKRRIAQHPDLASGDNYDFYTMENDTVQEVNFRNLKVDLWEHEESRTELQAFQRYRILQVGLISAGAGIAAASLLAAGASGNITPITATGLIMAGCSVLVQFPKRDALKNAIDLYN